MQRRDHRCFTLLYTAKYTQWQAARKFCHFWARMKRLPIRHMVFRQNDMFPSMAVAKIILARLSKSRRADRRL
jgi:hypothetical protein